MRMSFEIPVSLRQFTQGTQRIDISDAATMPEAVQRLGEDYPQLVRRIAAPGGEFYDFVGVFVNDRGIAGRPGHEIALSDGDVVSIVPAVAGG